MLRIGSSDLRVPWESYPLTACLCKQVRLIESSECGQQSSNHEVKFPTAPDWVNSVCLSPVPLEFSWLPQMIPGPSYWPPHIRPSSLPIVQSPSHQGCCKCFLLGYCSSHCSVPKRWSNLSFQIFLYSRACSWWIAPPLMRLPALPCLGQAAEVPPAASEVHLQWLVQHLLPLTGLSRRRQEENQHFHPYVYQSENACWWQNGWWTPAVRKFINSAVVFSRFRMWSHYPNVQKRWWESHTSTTSVSFFFF